MKKRIFTQEEEIYFLDNIGKTHVREICERLGFSTAAYYRAAKEYGCHIREPQEQGAPIEWTPEMLETLRREFPTALNQDLGRKLGVSQTTLHRKARELKLKKVPDHRERNLQAIAARISRPKSQPESGGQPGPLPEVRAPEPRRGIPGRPAQLARHRDA